MKKSLFTAVFMLVVLTAILQACHDKQSEIQPTPAVGTLTAYYATEDLKDLDTEMEFKKGNLICDSNDPINRMVDQDSANYKYEGDDTGEYYSFIIPKSKVEKRTYTMNQLPTEIIGEKKEFVAENGLKASIFLSKRNGHQYYFWNSESGETYVDEEKTALHDQCYVLSVELNSFGEKTLFEDQLETDSTYLRLYCKSRFDAEDSTPDNCRYREGLIGFIEEAWYNEDAPYGQSNYNEAGELQYDQYTTDGSIPEYISIAYIADLNALYVNGVLYFAKDSGKSATQKP